MSELGSPLDIVKQAEAIGRLSVQAALYGPFFFSLLFILLVPVLGQYWFSRMLQARTTGSREERSRAMQVYRFYWVSGVIAGLVLMFSSSLWWGYVQWSYVLPAQDRAQAVAEQLQLATAKAAVNKAIREALHQRVVEGVITGVSPNDMFLPEPGRQDYRLYVFPITNQVPMVARFVVIFDGIPPEKPIIRLPYMDRRTYNAIIAARGGFLEEQPSMLTLCIGRHHPSEFSLVRNDDTGPHLNVHCGG